MECRIVKQNLNERLEQKIAGNESEIKFYAYHAFAVLLSRKGKHRYWYAGSKVSFPARSNRIQYHQRLAIAAMPPETMRRCPSYVTHFSIIPQVC